MGVNYYFVSKGYKDASDKIHKIYEDYNDKIKWLVFEYQREIEKVITNLPDSAIYDNRYNLEFMDEYTTPRVWEYEIPTIHIGKSSSGLKFLFQETPYYGLLSVDDIIKFYNDNKDTIIIINEYGEEYKGGIEQFIKDEVDSTYREYTQGYNEYVSRSDYDSKKYYYIDDRGYEFNTREFS